MSNIVWARPYGSGYLAVSFWADIQYRFIAAVPAAQKGYSPPIPRADTAANRSLSSEYW